jgi:hypothetical protein
MRRWDESAAVDGWATAPARRRWCPSSAVRTEGPIISDPREIPATAARRLAAIAFLAAARNGDPSPESIEALATTREQALEATSGGRIPGSDRQTVYLIVMKGDFTLSRIPRRRHGKALTGHYLTITFDAVTFRRLDLGLGDRAPAISLHSIGPVSNLMSDDLMPDEEPKHDL